MNETTLNTAVALEATLPITWSVAEEVSRSHAELRMHNNISLLRALAAIDVVTPEHETHVESTHKALERVEAKMDVVLLMMEQLMGLNKPLPPETQVSMFSTRLIWVEHGTAPAVGQSVVVDLYLNVRLPQALHLPVIVKELQPQEKGVKVIAEFLDMTEDFDEWLTRTLFRYHRRALQASKQL